MQEALPSRSPLFGAARTWLTVFVSLRRVWDSAKIASPRLSMDYRIYGL